VNSTPGAVTFSAGTATARPAASGWWGNLRGRLILIALIAIVPIVGLTMYNAVQVRRRALADGRATVERLARLAESDLERSSRGAHQLLHAMAGNPALRGDDLAACSTGAARCSAYLSWD